MEYNIMSVHHSQLTEEVLVMVVVLMNELEHHMVMSVALHCFLSSQPTGVRAQKKLFAIVTTTWAAQRGRAPPGWRLWGSSVSDTRVR